MAVPSTIDLRQLPPFSALDPAVLETLLSSSQTLSFRVGQMVSDGNLIPSQVLVILEGQARLLGLDQGKLITLGKLGPGGIIGLASLLRAGGCETITASTPLVALAIPDSELLRLHQEQPAFREWCDATLFPAEVSALLSELINRSARSVNSYQEAFAFLLQQGKLFTSVNGTRPPQSDQVVWLSASNNLPDLPVGSLIGESLPASRPPLPARLIGIPAQLYESLHAESQPRRMAELDSQSVEAAENTPSTGMSDSWIPSASGLELGHYAPKQRFRLVRAEGPVHEALASFQMLTAELEMPFRRDGLEKVLRDVHNRGQTFNIQIYGNLAAMLGLHVSSVVVPAAMGTRLQAPSLIPWKTGFALLKSSNSEGILLASPRDGWVQLRPEQFPDAFPDGIAQLIIERTNTTPENKFGISWFWPALKRYRGVLIQVLIASFVVQLFGLANPLLIQVIIDKVITQRSMDTLQILGFGLVVVTFLEAILGGLRTFLFTETTNRIDTRLGAEVIDHLLRLPLGYFDRRPVGELSSRIAELEKIRNFLTGQGLTTILDAAFSVIYIVVMVFYSWLLTIVALMVLPIQIALTVVGAPLFRRQTRDVAQENANTQSHLVEVLSGIQTVKAQNVEMVSRWKWQDLYNKYISRTFEKTLTGTTLNETSTMLQKLSQLLVLWVGASLVLKGELTLGQLIAFRIISGYVTQPLLRLSNIWQSVQELKVSFERLADVIDTPEESDDKDKANIPLPPISGDIDFQDVSFRFNKGGNLILKNINLSIPKGTFVGIVGQSGSGKSTLMKLLPRLYHPDSGKIKIDGFDITKVELYSLRRQIGIVPQDPLLFSGTVSENIALTDPDANSSDIVAAARIASAHDFIMDLAKGYSSDVGERGSALSGGQRQRVAIARTLLGKPRLLVMDEATSALDYETERHVCDNLKESLKDCTVFFITHRLNTIRNADVIVMMHQGAIAEVGTHDSLMAEKGRYYALYRQQESS